MMTSQSREYDVLPFSDGSGKLYLGNLRGANYYRDGDLIRVTLEGRDAWGKQFARKGTCERIEAAEVACTLWVAQGLTSIEFREVKRANS